LPDALFHLHELFCESVDRCLKLRDLPFEIFDAIAHILTYAHAGRINLRQTHV